MSMGSYIDDDQGQLPALSSVSERFRFIFDAVNDGIFLTDPMTGQFIEINQRGCQIFGYAEAELIGRDIQFLSSGVHPYTLAVAIAQAEKARRGHSQTFEWQCKTKENVLFWADISISYADIGHIPAIVAIVRDITARKLQDEDLRLALERESAANKAKSEFLANMSHELRTPLNAIIGFSDFMLTQKLGPLGNPRYREYLDDIHRSGQQLLALIDDLLDLSRIDAGKEELVEHPVSLRQVISEAERMVDLQAKQSNVQIVSTIPDHLPHILGDERRIKQIVLNLLSNALKFTPSAGTVSVKATVSADGLLFEVSDNGIGIAKADLPRALERFGQIDSMLARKHNGTGLGLPLVKKLVELHGGSLRIASEAGVGTTVTALFPLERIIRSTASVAA